MKKIERILCPIDFSEFSEKVYDYAQSLAWHYKATLFLQHVIDSLTPPFHRNPFPDSYSEIAQSLRAGAKRQLQEFAETHTRPGILPDCSVSDGVATDLILGFAEAQAVNLIVMGTHGLRGIDHLVLGSVTEKVLQKARRPVLAVCKPAHDPVTPGQESDLIHLHRILYCTDFSDASENAFANAVALAAEYKAELTQLHVLEGVSDSADIEIEIVKAMQSLEKRIPPETRKSCTTKGVVRIGKAYQQIVELASESQTDLIVMGVRGRHSIDRAIFGSTTYRVIQLGPCPVLVVHI